MELFCGILIYLSISLSTKQRQQIENSSVLHQSGEYFYWRPFVLFTDLSFIVIVHEKGEDSSVPAYLVCVSLLQWFPHGLSLVCSEPSWLRL